MPEGTYIYRTIGGIKYRGSSRWKTKAQARKWAENDRKEGYNARVIVLNTPPYNDGGYKYWVFRTVKKIRR